MLHPLHLIQSVSYRAPPLLQQIKYKGADQLQLKVSSLLSLIEPSPATHCYFPHMPAYKEALPRKKLQHQEET